MSKKRIDNTLYRHVMSTVNRVLFLEYAIRAAYDRYPAEMQKLRDLDLEIRRSWIEFGLKENEIDLEDFMDFAWDFIQVGHLMTHVHGRTLHPELKRILDVGLPQIRDRFAAAYQALQIVPTLYYRVCDLLRGNDILRLMKSVSQALRDATSYEMEDDIFISKFIRHTREPIFLHPGFSYQPAYGNTEADSDNVTGFALIVDFNAQFNELDMKRQFREFQYQYATLRTVYGKNGLHDPVSHNLVNGAAYEDFYGFDGEDSIVRHDGFMSVLSGIYCYDRYHELQSAESKARVKSSSDNEDSPLDRAVKETEDFYPKGGVDRIQVKEDAIRKNYNTFRKKLKKFEFASTPQLVGDIDEESTE
jgi:hypothetical protein